MPLEPQIIFEDAHLIVLSKPAGLLSQGDVSGEDSLVDWLRNYFGRNYVGLVHRLDRNTSGAMVVAKRTKAAQRLTESLQKGELNRIYYAALNGNLVKPAEWRHWLIKDENKNQMSVIPTRSKNAKEAILIAKPIQSGSWKGHPITFAEVKLETGRSHQIRVQAAAQGYPVLGDVKYGPFIKEPWNQSFGRPALHSHKISFPHPMSKDILTFEAELPKDMKQLKSMITSPV